MVDATRDLMFREAARDSTIPGVIFTFVWGLDLADHTDLMKKTAGLFEANGGKVYFVELLASLETRMSREGTPFRVQLKPSQRNVEAARARQIEMDAKYRMNTGGTLPLAYPHLVLDTEQMDPVAAAKEITNAFPLTSGA